MTASYLPEGDRIHTKENKESLSTLSGLLCAMAKGQILEAPALLCDREMDLHFSLGKGICGIMPRKEVLYMPNGDDIKDIAVLTRVGKPVCFKLLSQLPDRDGMPCFLLSRRAAQQAYYEQSLSKLCPGDLLSARVTHMEHFGAFVDIGCGVVALLSIDCISVSRITHPKLRFHAGERIPVLIKAKEESGRIYVTHKELLGTWEENAALFSPGQTVIGMVRGLERYGIFVELTPNLTGLAEWRDDVKENDMAAVYIKSIIPEKMKIKLVIIDSHAPGSASSALVLPAFPSSSGLIHMTEWHYSPPTAPKQIYTLF